MRPSSSIQKESLRKLSATSLIDQNALPCEELTQTVARLCWKLTVLLCLGNDSVRWSRRFFPRLTWLNLFISLSPLRHIEKLSDVVYRLTSPAFNLNWAGQLRVRFPASESFYSFCHYRTHQEIYIIRNKCWFRLKHLTIPPRRKHFAHLSLVYGSKVTICVNRRWKSEQSYLRPEGQPIQSLVRYESPYDCEVF